MRICSPSCTMRGSTVGTVGLAAGRGDELVG